MGIIVNFAARTVSGFGFPVGITSMDDVTVAFSGSDPKAPNQVTEWTINGAIDRITGEMERLPYRRT
jgi:hypothetical protein